MNILAQQLRRLRASQGRGVQRYPTPEPKKHKKPAASDDADPSDETSGNKGKKRATDKGPQSIEQHPSKIARLEVGPGQEVSEDGGPAAETPNVADAQLKDAAVAVEDSFVDAAQSHTQPSPALLKPSSWTAINPQGHR